MTEPTGTGESTRSSASEESRNPIRRLYDWVLGWADTPYGSPALFGISLAESSFFPLPPDPLLLALALGKPKRALRFAGVATIASVIGGIIGYAIGAGAWSVAGDWFFQYVPGVSQEAFDRVEGLFTQWGFAFVFMAGLTPIPYKVFTLSSGVVGFNFPVFVLASFLSRGLRFFAVAGLVYVFGPSIQTFIDKHFNRLAIAFTVLVVAGFAVIEFLL